MPLAEGDDADLTNADRNNAGRTDAMNMQRPPSTTTDGDAVREREALLDSVTPPPKLRVQPRAALRRISDAVREELIDIVSTTGGHLGAGLGVVELSVALHYVFDTPRDKLVWDVSHQCYPHKILTGRREAMRRIRMGGGPSGFTNRAESDYDPFGAAHSSTAISAALGFATARDFQGADGHAIAVIGDGAITGGMAVEALYNAGAEGRRLIVILNDNDMSIAPPAGALQHLFAELRGTMPDAETRATALIESETVPSFAGRRTLFDDLGVTYAGPFDGHDIDEMVAVLEKARDGATGPILIHVITEKGKGYAPAMESGCKYHGVAKFDIESGAQKKPTPSAPSYTGVFAKSLIAAAKRDESIVAVSAAMPSGTGLDKFGKAFPDRCFDVGIAEQHAVTFCGALACEGFKPVAAIYSTFLQRAYDQVVHDIAIQRLPVRFVLDRAGMVGADGVTHQGSYDIAYLGCLPGFVLMAAADEADLAHMVETALAIDDRPSALRYPRGEGVGVLLPEAPEALAVGRGRVIKEGSRVAILSYGARLSDSLAAATTLEHLGHATTVADARFAKPVDDRLIRELIAHHEVVLTVEEGSSGGFATMVMDSISRQGLSIDTRRFASLYLPDRFIDHDSQAAQILKAGLDSRSIARRALHALSVSDRRIDPRLPEAAE
jgi:1-deoxy-D-xylulose-5-phosphate synthase